MMERKEAIERIKKLMAVAGDESATENEVLVAIAMADKLRIKYKIAENEIKTTNSNDIEDRELIENGYGYYVYPLMALGEHFRCEIARCGRLNGREVQFFAYGFSEDIALLDPVAKAMTKYLNRVLFGSRKYSSQKMKYSYLVGFSEGLREALEESVKELDLEKKYEVSVVGVPEVVKEFTRTQVTPATRTKGYDIDVVSWCDGFESGLKYQI